MWKAGIYLESNWWHLPWAVLCQWGMKTKKPRGLTILAIYCKNKLVVLTTEWLPWLQKNWRDRVMKGYSELHKVTQQAAPNSSYNHNTPADNPQNRNHLLAFVMTHWQMYWGLSVHVNVSGSRQLSVGQLVLNSSHNFCMSLQFVCNQNNQLVFAVYVLYRCYGTACEHCWSCGLFLPV